MGSVLEETSQEIHSNQAYPDRVMLQLLEPFLEELCVSSKPAPARLPSLETLSLMLPALPLSPAPVTVACSQGPLLPGALKSVVSRQQLSPNF